MRKLYEEQDEITTEPVRYNTLKRDEFSFNRNIEDEVMSVSRDIQEKEPEYEQKAQEPKVMEPVPEQYAKEPEIIYNNNSAIGKQEHIKEDEPNRKDYAAIGPEVRMLLECAARLEAQEQPQASDDYGMVM